MLILGCTWARSLDFLQTVNDIGGLRCSAEQVLRLGCCQLNGLSGRQGYMGKVAPSVWGGAVCWSGLWQQRSNTDTGERP